MNLTELDLNSKSLKSSPAYSEKPKSAFSYPEKTLNSYFHHPFHHQSETSIFLPSEYLVFWPYSSMYLLVVLFYSFWLVVSTKSNTDLTMVLHSPSQEEPYSSILFFKASTACKSTKFLNLQSWSPRQPYRLSNCQWSSYRSRLSHKQ